MSSSQKNILVIDDSAIIRSFVRNILEDANYKVYEACDGEEGIELYKKCGNIDLVMTDIYMPKKSGLEVVVELQKKYKGTKIIVFSDGGKDNFTNDSGVCEALGAAYFIKKDLIKDKLLDLVNIIFSK
ncbi:response regulator [Clostridium sp. FAM 1755]|uniref:Stage 0 sporulation protein A homolog n=2 Tax=Clostridium TaxID=1485 RepID=A0A6M0SW67_CLOBO|nr:MULTISPECIES: response regulator [Clostridium]EJP6474056.1 response regulator [Clostridium botulinum]KOR24646.1 chemotaxis protein CheY [Clostridium sp. L74]MDS1005161.1 response regulator [Clostridium sporogenes]NFA59759.1 response regulator [Clostridium botulinum]NFI72111.1 response regulator [Clostridium sporogenes]